MLVWVHSPSAVRSSSSTDQIGSRIHCCALAEARRLDGGMSPTGPSLRWWLPTIKDPASVVIHERLARCCIPYVGELYQARVFAHRHRRAERSFFRESSTLLSTRCGWSCALARATAVCMLGFSVCLLPLTSPIRTHTRSVVCLTLKTAEFINVFDRFPLWSLV